MDRPMKKAHMLPAASMFQLTPEEFGNLRFHIGASNLKSKFAISSGARERKVGFLVEKRAAKYGRGEVSPRR